MKQEAGRRELGDLAAEFARLNDDVLFGEVWSRTDKLSIRDRSIITVTALMSKGIFDNSLKYHLNNAKLHGVTKEEMLEIITQLAFYVGWPNAWAVFPLVREVYASEIVMNSNEPLFGLGEENEGYAKYFIGKSYPKPLNINGVGVFNVTFEPASRNNWHIHNGGGQILLVTDGEGWYQEWDQEAKKLHPGDVVYIAPGVKHWHGATKDHWFTHIAMEIPSKNGSTSWCEAVEDQVYFNLDKKGE